MTNWEEGNFIPYLEVNVKFKKFNLNLNKNQQPKEPVKIST